MADFIERIAFGEVHNEDISLFTIIQISSHVVDELYKLSFARSKFAFCLKPMVLKGLATEIVPI
jgi:hypothetical protein